MRASSHVAPGWLLAVALAAQERPPVATDPAAALRSDEPTEVAWAAHDLEGEALRAMVGPLRAALRTWSQHQNVAAPRVRLSLLDALVRADARLPAEDVAPLLDEAFGGNAALVLLLREPRANERILSELFARRAWPARDRTFHDEHYRTLALGNALCAQRAPGFAALAWKRADHRLHVDVPAPEPSTTLGVVAVTEDSGQRSWRQGPYPPRVVHELSVTREPVAEPFLLVAAGPCNVRYRRLTAEDPAAQRRWRGTIDGWMWLSELSPAAPSATDRRRRIPFPDAATWLADVEAARAELRRQHEACLADLVRSGAMTAAEAAAASLKVAVVVHDEVADRNPPLPTPADR